MIDLIPPATEFKQKMDAKRVLLTAAQGSTKPDVAKNFLAGVLRALTEEFNRVLLSSPSAPASFTFSMDASQISPEDRADISPLLPQIRTYLQSLGYTVTVLNGVATISW